MKRLALAAGLVLAALALPATAHAGTGGASVQIVQASTYDAPDAAFELTVCIDDEVIELDVPAGTVLDPITLDPGTYEIEFLQSDNCDDSLWSSTEFTVADGDDITLMGYWGFEDVGVAVFDNDTSCIEPGEARVTFRHAASVYTDGGDLVDAFMTPSEGDDVQIADGVSVGEQQITDIPAQVYTDANAYSNFDDSLVTSLGNPGDTPEGAYADVYIYGGGDGDVSYFVELGERDICEEPTTTTTAAPTTTTTAAAAAVVTPRFTG